MIDLTLIQHCDKILCFNLDLISITIGIGLVILFLLGLKFFKKKKVHTLPEIKTLIKEAHVDMLNAATKQAKLWNIFNEIEGDLK